MPDERCETEEWIPFLVSIMLGSSRARQAIQLAAVWSPRVNQETGQSVNPARIRKQNMYTTGIGEEGRAIA